MNAIDMTRFIEAKSDQLNADDLIGGPRTVTVASVSANDGDQPVNIWLENEPRAFRPCKTIRRVMVAMWGADASQYVGRSMTIYRDPSVQFGGMQVGGIRISHMSHIDGARDVVVMKSKGKKAAMKILPLATQAKRTAAPAADPGASGSPNTEAAPGQASGEVSQAALDWTAETIAAIHACTTITELAELQERRAKGLGRLSAYPKLIGDVTASFADRRAALDGGAA